jgi:hypothetical protein
LLPYRQLDDAVGLTEIAGDVITNTCRGKNGRHGLVGQFRQSVFGRLGGYDDVNDSDRLSLDPVMRWIVGGHAVTKQAASTSLSQEGMKFSTLGSGFFVRMPHAEPRPWASPAVITAKKQLD